MNLHPRLHLPNLTAVTAHWCGAWLCQPSLLAPRRGYYFLPLSFHYTRIHHKRFAVSYSLSTPLQLLSFHHTVPHTGTNARSRTKGLAPPIGPTSTSTRPSACIFLGSPMALPRPPLECTPALMHSDASFLFGNGLCSISDGRRRSPAGQTATTKLHKTRSAALPKYTIGLNLLWGLLLLLGRRAARKVDRLAVLVLQRAKELPLLTLVLCERLVECA